MKRKGLVTLGLTACLASAGTFSSFAGGGWTVRDNGFVYLYEDGTYAINEWKKSGEYWFYLGEDGYLARNKWQREEDGKWYYLDENGAMLTNTTTPDGYTVNEDGCWTVDGVVQIQ